MNILFDARVIQDHFPGIGRYAYNLLKRMPQYLGAGDTITALYQAGASSHYDLAGLGAPTLTLLKSSTPVFGLRNLARMPTADRGMICHFPYYMRPVTRRRRTVTTIHDLISFIFPQHYPSIRRRLWIRLFNALAVASSEIVLTVSRHAAGDIAHFFPSAARKIVTIYEAADPTFQPIDEAGCRAVLDRLRLPPRFALYLASNKPHKNLARLVEAWQQVIKKGKSPLLVVAGHQDARYLQAQDRARELGIAGQVRFIGEVNNADMPALYSACDLFVYPSLYEGFGLTPLEAMACGAPIACSNASSLPEVAGDAALLFDPTSPDEIAAACLRVLQDPALTADLRQRSLKQAARFTWDETARATVEVYRSLA